MAIKMMIRWTLCFSSELERHCRACAGNRSKIEPPHKRRTRQPSYPAQSRAQPLSCRACDN